MKKRILTLTIIFIVAGTMLWQTQSSAVQTIDFVRDVQPIFKANCDKCHGAQRFFPARQQTNCAENDSAWQQ